MFLQEHFSRFTFQSPDTNLVSREMFPQEHFAQVMPIAIVFLQERFALPIELGCTRSLLHTAECSRGNIQSLPIRKVFLQEHRTRFAHNSPVCTAVRHCN